MFGVEKRVERVRAALVRALQAKSLEIMTAHAALPPEQIPRHDLARALVLNDLAGILANLRVEKKPGDDEP
jgi:hypothetical protein